MSSIFLWAALISCLYLPTLATPFDFIDDGNLVYPSHAATLAGKAEYYWQCVVANYEDLGPFRPTLWAHWRVEAELFNANPHVWRAARLVFTFLATASVLMLLVELRIAWPAALFTTALAMWNPYRNEIWTSLTLSEGVAMPYAVMALVCALRAARSARPWRWDIAGLLCMLVALGCKNTFAAVIPVQLFFRVAPDGRDVPAGLRRHWPAVCVLAVAVALPVCHYLYFISHWHAGQYQVGGNAWKQFKGMLGAEKGAVSMDFMAAGYILALVAALANGAARACVRKAWNEYRAPLLGGFVLLCLGIGIYLKIDDISGRYSIPAVWGLDMWIGVLLTLFAAAPKHWLKRLAAAALGIGLVAVAISNLGRQDKFAARAEVLWQVVHYIEAEPPADKSIAWVAAKKLEIEEGIHIAWHLDAQGYPQAGFSLYGPDGPQSRRELPENTQPPEYAITSDGQPVPLPGNWELVRDFKQPYWFGKRSFTCAYWRREDD